MIGKDLFLVARDNWLKKIDRLRNQENLIYVENYMKELVEISTQDYNSRQPETTHYTS